MNSEINETIGQSSYKELVEAIGKALSDPNGKCNLDKDQLANRALYCRVRAERKRTCRIWGRVVEPPIA